MDVLIEPPPESQPSADIDRQNMARACDLALHGQGFVEPNPMVGCLVWRHGKVVGEGWHQSFGGPHAEANALQQAGELTHGATVYVTLEPCCHQGKTPPCAPQLIAAGVRRVIVGCLDPNPRVAGAGVGQLRAAGVQVEVGTLQQQAERLIDPFRKWILSGKPWVIAKWAMTVDGKLAAVDGTSRWITNETARQCVHRLRSRVDAVVVGSRTALVDDPMLTARPAGPRTPLRVVVDSLAVLPLESQLVQSAREVPVLLFASSAAEEKRLAALEKSGVEVVLCDAETSFLRIDALLNELGGRQFSNVLVEGGGTLLGALADADQIDEVYAFVGPLITGGAGAPTACGGKGRPTLADALQFDEPQWSVLGDNALFHGRVRRELRRPS